MEKNKGFIEYLYLIIGFAISMTVLMGIYNFFSWFADLFLKQDKEIAALVLTTIASVIISILSILISKRWEVQNQMKKEIREKKTPHYEKLISLFFDSVYNERLGKPPLTEKDYLEFAKPFLESFILWGSEEVIEKFIKFRATSMIFSQEETEKIILSVTGELILAMRKDLGQSNKNIKGEELMALFINDLTEKKGKELFSK